MDNSPALGQKRGNTSRLIGIADLASTPSTKPGKVGIKGKSAIKGFSGGAVAACDSSRSDSDTFAAKEDLYA